jgi:hypothetical protein
MTALSSLDLGISDLPDTPTGYALTSYQFPSKDIEVTARFVDTESPSCAGGAKRKNKSKKEMDAETLAISSRRSKTAVRRKVLTFCPSILMTLTFRHNVTDLDVAWARFKYFSKLMKQHYKEEWMYVCVPETQDRGAWHFHLGVRKSFHNRTWKNLHVLWKRAVGDLGGNVDMQLNTKKNGKKTAKWKPSKLSGYLAKYITKDANAVGFNKRRYSSAGVKLEPISGFFGFCNGARGTKGHLASNVTDIEHLLESLCHALSEHPINYRYHSKPHMYCDMYYYST